MKQRIINFYTFFNTLLLQMASGTKNIKGSRFYRSQLRGINGNSVTVTNSTLESTVIDIVGSGNTVQCNKSYIGGAHIIIEGINNKLVFSDGIEIRDAVITMRGQNCEITIGSNTTFEGVRMITVGKSNKITVGADCLFSDYIEIWASDTHTIKNENGDFINPEKSITIGNKVWVGSRVTILKGVTINDGSIIGMASVVTKDVPANVISAGSPSKTIKENISWDKDYPNEKTT